MKAAIFLLLFLAAASDAAADWSRADTYREIAAELLLAADWSQTSYIAKHPDEWHESWNPFLGEHPSSGAVDKHFAAWLIAHPVISYLLPGNYRKIWQYTFIVVETGAVAHNAAAGVRFNF